ncbi:hypothetical protein LQV05_000176 [Cryptococcus neoformans]|nr:hypothetical protein LQV05_000176 [Cryptococcus neoformans]
MSGHYNLKALIKAIRSCKTLADERSVIQKESAAIRTSFKEEDTFARHNNIAKLLYIHMLGYPAHFGQIECLKLVASPRFSDKRLGYLGIMLLLDENQEVLTLVTNSLKNDMNHFNVYAVGLALCAFANISSEEMSRDLSNEVEKLLGSSNAYIRKKAALCALRIIRRVPDLLDHFTSKAKSLLQDRNHGVLLAGITLVTEMCAINEDVCAEFRRATGLLVKHLKNLVSTGYSAEHDVLGIADPFLQTKILRLLRLLGKGDVASSEAMNDILAQVATNTDSSKNVGNSILYETVLTVLEIEADSGLRVMAINILGKFLTNRDNNIRQVDHLSIVSMDTNAVQRHRNTIIDCLRDGDISIRRRALELSYALVNDSNITVMTRELLSFLEVADNEFKLGLTTEICLAAERFAPNKRWQIDTVLRVLKIAGNFVRDEILSAFIRLVSHTPELQFYTAQRLYAALSSDLSQESLTLATVWVIGEFGDILLQGGTIDDGEKVKQVSDSDLVDLLEHVLNSPYADSLTRQFVMTALAKLSVRISELSTPNRNTLQDRIAVMLASFSSNLELEIQQRAVEFGSLFALREVKMGVLERMPPPEIKATIMGTVSERKPVGSTRTDKDMIADLIGDESAPNTAGLPVAATGPSTQDLLADIFGTGASDIASPGAGSPTAPKSNANDIMSLFDTSPTAAVSPPVTSSLPAAPTGGSLFDLVTPSPSTSSAPTPASAAMPAAKPQLQSYTAYDKNSLKITLTPKVLPAQPGVVQILARFTASGTEKIEGVNMQVAVPKTQQLQMQAMSSQEIAPGGVETQQMRVHVSVGAAIRLRMRISFIRAGQSFTDQQDFAGFPAGLTGSK